MSIDNNITLQGGNDLKISSEQADVTIQNVMNNDVSATAGLNNGQTKQASPPEPPPPPPPPPPVIKVKVSSDNMMAYVRVKVFQDNQPVSDEDIVTALIENGVKSGICAEDIHTFCEKRAFYSELVAARGVHAVAGQDGSLTYHFKIDNSINIYEKEDGTVDYKELGLIQNVKAGQVLCTILPPIPGIDGKDILGNPVPFKEGNMPDPRAGENTVMSEDGLKVLAKIDGCVEMKNNQIYVNDVFTIDGDLDISVGNIDCVGSVLVKGDVREGFTVKAGKDVVVKGMVEGAVINAGGNVTISNGVNGMGIGVINATGNVTSKYIENTTVNCESSIYSDVIMNSRISAGDSVILKGKKACIIGGVCKVGKMVYAAYIGSHTNAATTVSVDSDELRYMLSPESDTEYENVTKLSTEIKDLQMQFEDLQTKIKEFSSNLSEPGAALQLKKTMSMKNKLAGKIKEHEERLQKAQSAANRLAEFRVLALKTCFTGVRIDIAYMHLNIEIDYNNSKFYAGGYEITAAPILPSDKI